MNYIKFLDNLCYLFGIVNIVIVILKVLHQWGYSDIQKSLDALKGVRVTWEYKYNIGIIIICLAWIFK